jgi:uncharacterized membrane protein
MKGNKNRVLTAFLSAVIAIVISTSIIAGNVVVPLITVVLAFILSYFLKRANKSVTQDERTLHLSGKAAETTIKICVPLAAVGGIILFASREHLSPEMVSAGYVLAYTACVLMLVNLAFYSFYSRKY